MGTQPHCRHDTLKRLQGGEAGERPGRGRDSQPVDSSQWGRVISHWQLSPSSLSVVHHLEHGGPRP